MPEFRHTTLFCGPRGQATLQQTECLVCRWHAAGRSDALKVAEHAHERAEHTAALSTPVRLFTLTAEDETTSHK